MKRGGNIVIAVLFVILLSCTGLALLTHSLLHSKIASARKGKWLAAAGLESALTLQLHLYRQQLESSDMNRYTAPENDFFNTVIFPDSSVGRYQVTNLFSRRALPAGSGFSKVRIFNNMIAGSSGSRLRHHGQAGVDLLQGDVPLDEIALLVTRELSGPLSAYLAGKGVDWPGSVLAPAGKTLLAGDCRLLLAEAMGLPATLPDWRQIREKFKLELSDAPIPPGIYLALAEGRIETIFVEGDLQRLAFAARGGEQTIVFQHDVHGAELRYRPGNDVLFWSGPDAVSGCPFAEKLIVHGNIWAIEQSGNAAFAAGASIQVLASGQMRVNTGLSKENLDLQKARFANLLLMTSDRDFFSDAALHADIVLASPAGSTIEAHLAAAGSVVHGEGLLNLAGSLIAGDIQNAGRLRVEAQAGRFDFMARRVVRDFKCLQNFQFHFIVEDSDEP